MAEATLSAKHQIVIPREAREALQLKAGDKLQIVVRGKRVIILEKPESPSKALLGIGRGMPWTRHLEKERRSWD